GLTPLEIEQMGSIMIDQLERKMLRGDPPSSSSGALPLSIVHAAHTGETRDRDVGFSNLYDVLLNNRTAASIRIVGPRLYGHALLHNIRQVIDPSLCVPSADPHAILAHPNELPFPFAFRLYPEEEPPRVTVIDEESANSVEVVAELLEMANPHYVVH